MTIAVHDLTKDFGTLRAVDSVDLEIGEGEVLCLLGPSGCGKTTTLRMIAGLEWATSGDIEIGGRRVNDLAARDRNVAMSFQFYALYPNLTVAENLAYPLYAESLGASEIERRAADVARILQLEEVMQRRPDQLAEGEKQRVAVGRSIIRDAACFLFDEPLSRLDVQLRETMRGEIKEVLDGLNKATVIVTHDQLEALTMADRIAVMRDGRIEQVASPHDIFTKPANLFVAGFIGTPQMNLIEATVTGQGVGGTELRMEDQVFTVPVRLPQTLADLGAGVTLGIRPRAFELASEAGSDTLTGRVDIIEPLGAETLLHLVVGERDLRVVVGRRTRPAVGETLHLRFRANQLHVFGPDEARVAIEVTREEVPA